MARLQKRTQAAVTTGSAGSSGIPRAMFDGLYVLSLETGLIASIVSATRERQHLLGLSTGRPGPHDFTVRIRLFVGANEPRCNPTRPPHPAPDVRDDARRPSAWGRTATVKHDFRKNERRILMPEGRKMQSA
jgi:hypothetical protein